METQIAEGGRGGAKRPKIGESAVMRSWDCVEDGARIEGPRLAGRAMTLKATDIHTAKPEEAELARKREEQAAIESELAERELRSANLRAEMGAFERQYLHFVGLRYAELDELKAEIAERLAT